jgi:hypothetical protein
MSINSLSSWGMCCDNVCNISCTWTDWSLVLANTDSLLFWLNSLSRKATGKQAAKAPRHWPSAARCFSTSMWMFLRWLYVPVRPVTM